jgi:selenocysteine lyase/cysteine desulfurase
MPGARVLDGGREQCAIVTAMFDGRDARKIVQGLKARNINTSASLRWYGLLDFSAKDVDAAVRISPHYYNTEDEIDRTLEAIRELIIE